MYDISCLLEHDLFDTIEEISYGLWFGANENIAAAGVGYTLGAIRRSWGISPKWEFALNGGEKRFVVVAGAGSVPSPHGRQSIPWLNLRGIDGDLVKQVFRIPLVVFHPLRALPGCPRSPSGTPPSIGFTHEECVR
ncbi:hypothetical protein BD779DRAFT_1804150 [Infundibulicybe gibba]|nr:hypothetical protein BD779DRAFT_1804150 [Infundibulicybe gibba]